MVSITLFCCSWIIFWFVGNKIRIAELFPTAMFSCFLGLLTDLVMEQYKLWSYHDNPLSPEGVPLSLDFGIYPIVAYLFIQFIPVHLGKRIMYTFFWTLGSILLEYFYLRLALIQYHKWWHLWMSYIADCVIFGLFILQYHYYAKGKVRS